jgi:DNA-binding HxlR family transcriptional regulator
MKEAGGGTGRGPVERVERIMGIIAGKWKPAIIYALVMNGTLRFNELRRLIPRVSQRMLTQQLRDLERHGLVDRVFFPEIPPRVEYSATRLGRSLHPIFKSVCNWAEKNFRDVEDAVARHQKA